MRFVLVLVLVGIAIAARYVTAATHAPPAKSPIDHVACGTPQKSIVSDTSLHLVFTNHTRGSVTIYWLDFKGERVWYNTLEAGQSYTQQTFVTHPWVIVDDEGHCLDQLVATEAGTFQIPIGKR
ncbi:MAG: hypothetical protein QM831_31985 [Kofleriaceae bacterium]